ncbi:hypothetical protein [Frigoriflavimonas asaccharolytica]|uniref:TolA-binding protein n=1 Tax=Frigoriflavimonas asaccharolytica TaxID=2735899 RepID=A0A8J8K6G9_9FLAO|nr:hypothetical protein [Frigoriflavimonas asaccharolytica]NRS93735.1 TolA-binding protein [Frigoriflavimonas asaccharolytica]
MKTMIRKFQNKFLAVVTLHTLSLTTMMLMLGTLLVGCGDSSKKDATNVKEDTHQLNQDVKQGAKDTNDEIKTAVNSDWEKFKTNSEIAIKDSEKQIQELRIKIDQANKNDKEKLTKQLDKLEEKNKELKEKLALRGKAFKEDMIEFNASAKENEKEFEREFKHDTDELGTAIKDFFKNNVN